MILKSYELKKINSDNKLILFYGKNDGLKEIAIREIVSKKKSLYQYDQNEIHQREENFLEEIYSQSLFEEEKIIVIKRISDKFISVVEKIDLTKLGKIKIILIGETLEKKSKLRSKFEKERNFVCIPFYADTDQALIKLAQNFIRERKMSISSSLINLIISKVNNDRKVLLNELNKLEIYSYNKKKIDDNVINKIINLNENHEINDLINYYLVQNRKKIVSILNENNFGNEDCIIIVRSLLKKAKKLLDLSNKYLKNQNIEATIAASKPPIFWKEKNIIKEQIFKWNTEDIKKLIYKLSEIELIIKKNINISINVISDFILLKQIDRTNN
ncbi:DNA polymerase III subunit delta [Candidatus Pelagibacter sp. HIMB1542]|uniref:DNA polymerase III subunit delta n=1 Tax=Candidatus Pelagibacter sp. HIMB1542 TaxID=3413346 RepID=UPI003F84EB7E